MVMRPIRSGAGGSAPAARSTTHKMMAKAIRFTSAGPANSDHDKPIPAAGTFSQAGRTGNTIESVFLFLRFLLLLGRFLGRGLVMRVDDLARDGVDVDLGHAFFRADVERVDQLSVLALELAALDFSRSLLQRDVLRLLH